MFPTFFVPSQDAEEVIYSYLINPSGAEPYTVGWTREAGDFEVISDRSYDDLQTGCFWGGISSYSRGSQRLDLLNMTPPLSAVQIDAGAMNIEVKWYGGTYNQSSDDLPKLSVRFLDASLVEISTATNGYFNPTTGGFPVAGGTMYWQFRTDTFDIPVNTRYLDIVLEFDRNTGTNNDGMADEISLRFFAD